MKMFNNKNMKIDHVHYLKNISSCPSQQEEVSDDANISERKRDDMSSVGKAVSATNTELRKVFKSSVAIIPPEEIWSQIQAIREKYDKVFVRWMPHINMLYPFVVDAESNFEDACQKLKEGLSSVKPFKVVFSKSSFGYFRHKKDCTLWLKPLEENPVEDTPAGNAIDHANTCESHLKDTERKPQNNTQEGKGSNTTDGPNCDKNVVKETESTDNNEPVEGASSEVANSAKLSKSELKKQRKKAQKEAQKNSNRIVSSNFRFHPDVISLQGTLESVYPNCNDLSSISGEGFKPHLSLGQFAPKDVDRFMQEFVESWSDIEFTVSEVCLISRADFDDPFHVRFRVPLGENAQC